MNNQIEKAFKRIGDLVNASGMSAEKKLMTVDCLKKLPALCKEFCVSYESRHVEEILRLEQGLLVKLESSPKARKLAKALSVRFKNLHEKIGLPQLKIAS